MWQRPKWRPIASATCSSSEAVTKSCPALGRGSRLCLSVGNGKGLKEQVRKCTCRHLPAFVKCTSITATKSGSEQKSSAPQNCAVTWGASSGPLAPSCPSSSPQPHPARWWVGAPAPTRPKLRPLAHRRSALGCSGVRDSSVTHPQKTGRKEPCAGPGREPGPSERGIRSWWLHQDVEVECGPVWACPSDGQIPGPAGRKTL